MAASRQRLVTLLSNYACDVGQHGDSRLYCKCTGVVMTALLGAGAVVSLLTMLNFSVLVMAGANERQGVVGGVMAVVMAITLTHLAIARQTRHGRFVIDAEQQVLRRYRGKRLVGEFLLVDVVRVWPAFDFTDALRPSESPLWLQVSLRSGEIFRLAKGSRDELAPVCRALERLGLSVG